MTLIFRNCTLYIQYLYYVNFSVKQLYTHTEWAGVPRVYEAFRVRKPKFRVRDDRNSAASGLQLSIAICLKGDIYKAKISTTLCCPLCQSTINLEGTVTSGKQQYLRQTVLCIYASG